ncbi:hypothetical protein SHAb15599_00170 [Acinetobacter phage SH-Ab 15599]|nr:hypothetical protein SHAb15599_00170 [Acinetobacter phage SH-Ab 15599]
MEPDNKPITSPSKAALERQRELEAAKSAEELNKAMHDLSKDKGDKSELLKAMKKITEQVKLSEDKQIDAITSAAIQTALDVSMQLRSLNDPALRRQALLTLKTINSNIKLAEDSTTHNVDQEAVKQNVKVAIDSVKTDSLLERIASNIQKDKMGVGDFADQTGPLFGLMKDVVKSVSKKIVDRSERKTKSAPQISFLDHMKERPFPVPKIPEVEEQTKPVKLPKPTVASSAPVVINNPVTFDYKEMKADILGLKDVDQGILTHIEAIAADIKEQLIMSKNDAEARNAEKMGNNFRHYKPKATPVSTTPTLAPPQGDTGGGILDFITPLLFGRKGLMKGIVSFIARAGVMVLAALSPKNLIKFAGNVITVVKDFIGGAFGKLGEAFDGLKGTLGKVSKLGKLTKSIPVIGQVIAVVVGLFDFFDAFSNADQVLGKAKEALTLWDKVSAGVGGFIGGIVGIVDVITGFFGFETDIGGFVKQYVAKKLADIPNVIIQSFAFLVDLKNTISDGLSTAKDKIESGFTFITDVFADVSNFIDNIGPTLKKLFQEKARDALNVLPGNLGDKFFPSIGNTDKQEKSSPEAKQKDAEKEAKKPLIERWTSDWPSLKDIFDTKEEREKEEKKAQAAIHQTTQNNTTNNVSNSSTNVYNSLPISTRMPDDSFKV